MHALLSDNNHFVHGAMRVLTEFSSEVTDAQIPQVAPIILPQMCLILTEDKVQLKIWDWSFFTVGVRAEEKMVG